MNDILNHTISDIQERLRKLERRAAILDTQDTPGNFTSGAVLFGSTVGKPTQDATNLFWDDTNNFLGIGTNAPSAFAHIKAAGSSKTFLQVEDTSTSSDILVKLIGSSIGSGSYFIRAQDGVPNDLFYVRGDGFIFDQLRNSSTSSTDTQLQLHHSSTGTPAAGFGSQILFQLDSSTNTQRNVATISTAWATATDASRKARVTFTVFDTAQREGLRIEGSGTAPMIGFLGGAAAAKQTVTGSRGGNAALASLLTALAAYGLITDSSSA